MGGKPFVTEQTTTLSGMPHRFLLRQNTPNPFNSTTTISFEVPPEGGSEFVVLRILDLLGRTVQMLFHGRTEPGVYTLTWDGLDDQGRPVSSGVYLMQMEARDFSDAKKISLLR
jgi:flagellar hook assembly protein FlgD